MKKVIIVTHSGSFHSDDVFGVATLELLCAKEGLKTEVLRSRDQKIWEKGDYVLDVGGENNSAQNKFDHHQEGGAGERENGIPYASFGLVWKKVGVQLCDSQDVADAVDKKLVQPLDAHDNGIEIITSTSKNICPYTIGNAISAFDNELFAEAVIFAKGVLAREINSLKKDIENQKLIEEAYRNASDKRVVIFDNSYNEFTVNEIMQKYPEVLYMLYLKDSLWNLKIIRKDPQKFEARKSFPSEWAGKRDEELAKITGVADAIFCHNKRFLVVAKSKEGALKLAELALNA
ncbi:MAG: MYG1 family protein [Patescibacteria group bacterium]|nr:MYG1 family protein [Patescibacteria group bacterium]